MFNLRKESGRKSKAITTHEDMLEEQREEFGLPKTVSTTESMLDDVRKDEEDVPAIDGRLNDVRSAKGTLNDWSEDTAQTIEAKIDSHKPLKTPKRTGNEEYSQLPVNLLAEIEDQKRAKAFEEARVTDANTDFWDKFTESETKNESDSQLHNHPDRFKDLSKGDILKHQGVKKMVSASLRDQDAMLYFIYRQAAEEKREVTTAEQKLIDGITADKEKLTAKLRG